jgi:cation diffusion facilitator CzcD-associated flavoprotein CzcO
MKLSSVDDSTKIVFVGGGLSSLIMAKVLIRKGIPARDITIVENSSELGGQYSSIRTDSSVFDLGMHIYYETGIEEIDSCFIDIQPENWIYLADNKKDIAGIFWNGNLQINSPYPDLRKKRFLKMIIFISIKMLQII